MSIRRNTIYNLLGSVVPLAVSLVTLPIYLNLIGESRYGVLAIAWLMLGYFGLFELGLGRATAHRIAVLHDAPAEERAQTFWAALIMNIGLGILGGLLIWPVAVYFFGNILQVEDVLRPEMQATVPWLVLAVPMATLSGVLTGALQGRERFLELSLISVLGTILFHLLPLCVAVFWGADLGFLLPAALFARVLTLVILFSRCRRHIISGYAPSLTRERMVQLLSYGSWVSLSSFIGPMMIILDRFVIGALFGANAVTYYTVPFQLGQRSMIISGALITALFPRFSKASLEEERRLAIEGLRLLIVIMTPLVVVGIIFMEYFLAWWISPEFADQSARVGQILLLGFWFNSLAQIPYVQLQARGRPDLVAKCYLVEILPYFGLLYLGMSLFGLVGAAAVFSLRVFVNYVLFASLSEVFRHTSRLLLLPVLLLIIAFFISMQSKYGQLEWIIYVLPHLLFTMIWAWWRSPDSLREIILNRLKPLFN